MNEQELRQMVRDSIARHSSAAPGLDAAPARAGHPIAIAGSLSFARFLLQRGGDDDGACMIEPSVRCNHCGFCQSYGH